jgi:dihydrofolate reductase
MRVNIIAAIDRNGLMGLNGDLPWRFHKEFLKEDLAHFKALTTNSTVIMGRGTFESIGKPLPDRQNIVVTRSEQICSVVCIVWSVEAALKFANYHPYGTEIFLIGGARIYQEALEKGLVNRVYLTYFRGKIKTKPTDHKVWFPLHLPHTYNLVHHKRTSYADYKVFDL